MTDRKLLTPSILHIITGLEVGGAERALYTLLTNGLEGPFRNQVISLMSDGHYGSKLRKAGIPVTALGMNEKRGKLNAMRRLLEIVSKTQFDVIQGWMLHGNLLATFAWRLRSKRSVLIWNVRNSLNPFTLTGPKKSAEYRLGAWLSERPTAIIYNSNEAKTQYTEFGFSNSGALVIPNGFDTNKWYPDLKQFGQLHQSLNLPENARVVGYIGRGHPLKDLSTLFCAFNQVASRHPNTYLITVGRDHQQYVLPSSRTVLLGERHDVPEVLRNFDLLCLSSVSEGFPNVVGEAMATGVPVVSTDVGEVDQLIGNTGWIVPVRSPDALAKSLDKALSLDPIELQVYGKRARARIIQHYSINRTVGLYKKLYYRLVTLR